MATVVERSIPLSELPPLTIVQKSKEAVRSDAISAAKNMIVDIRRRVDSPEKHSLIHPRAVVLFMQGVQLVANELQDRGVSPEAARFEGIKSIVTDLIEKDSLPIHARYQPHPEVVFTRMILRDNTIREIGRNILFDKKS